MRVSLSFHISLERPAHTETRAADLAVAFAVVWEPFAVTHACTRLWQHVIDALPAGVSFARSRLTFFVVACAMQTPVRVAPSPMPMATVLAHHATPTATSYATTTEYPTRAGRTLHDTHVLGSFLANAARHVSLPPGAALAGEDGAASARTPGQRGPLFFPSPSAKVSVPFPEGSSCGSTSQGARASKAPSVPVLPTGLRGRHTAQPMLSHVLTARPTSTTNLGRG